MSWHLNNFFRTLLAKLSSILNNVWKKSCNNLLQLLLLLRNNSLLSTSLKDIGKQKSPILLHSINAWLFGFCHQGKVQPLEQGSFTIYQIFLSKQNLEKEKKETNEEKKISGFGTSSNKFRTNINLIPLV